MVSSPNRVSHRQFVYLPDIAAQSALLFFRKGPDPYCWSLRNYSQSGPPVVLYGQELKLTAEELLAGSRHREDAEAIPTANLAYWHEETQRINLKWDLTRLAVSVSAPPRADNVPFPVLAHEELLQLGKSAKTGDMKRIYSSKNSEDWVTWNLLQLLRSVRPAVWAKILEDCAARQNAQARAGLAETQMATLHFWECAEAPRDYEARSRERMRTSDIALYRDRALRDSPVEGRSEIDVIVRSPQCLIFIEAKLGSDISTRTSYDPGRNQIARNIDCLLEQCGQKRPMFWMLVRDRNPERAYVQTMEGYRREPETLHRELPHRRLEDLRGISATLAIITWRELASGWIDTPVEDEVSEQVRAELLERI